MTTVIAERDLTLTPQSCDSFDPSTGMGVYFDVVTRSFMRGRFGGYKVAIVTGEARRNIEWSLSLGDIGLSIAVVPIWNDSVPCNIPDRIAAGK